MKKHFLFLFTLACACSLSARTLYLVPNSNWTQDNAKFSAHYFGGTVTTAAWTDFLTSADGTHYEAIVPDGATTVIFVRHNPAATSPSWTEENNTWNQTNDLTIPTDGKNCYTVADGAWSNGDGAWSTYTVTTPRVAFGAEVPTSVEVNTEITLSATSENFSGEVSYAYSVKVPDATSFTAIEGTAYTPSVAGTYTLKVVATAGEESAEKEQTLTVTPAATDITIRVQIPTGMTGWDDTVTPNLYYWITETDGKIAEMASEGENWYSYTVHAATINFIVVNGNGWNGDARQTEDVKGVTASDCYVLGNATGKKTVTSTDCPTTEPSVAFNGVASTATVGDVITLAATYKNFSATPTITYSVKAPNAEDFTPITGTSYTVPKQVGVYVLKVVATAGEESAEKTLNVTVTTQCYLAGSGIEGLGWEAGKQMPMYDNTITLANVAANTKITFKVVFDSQWLGFSYVDTENSSKGVEGSDNIEITTSTDSDVEIKYDASTQKIIVTGDFGGVVAITSYTVAGTKELMGTETEFDVTATANDMVETAEGSNIWTLTKENVALVVQTYQYKVAANHAWGVKEYPGSGNNMLDIKAAGNYDVTFTLDLTGETGSLTAVAKIKVENYTIVGDKDLLGSDWDLNDAANTMTEAAGVWTLTKTNVALNVGTYNYKSVANHAWGVQDFPTDESNKTIDVTEDGYYTVTFTLNPKTSLECALTKTAPAEYKYNVTYGIEEEGAVWEVVTLTQVGATTEWTTAEVTLPADISDYKCYVAYNKGFGDPKFVEEKSATVALSSVGGEGGAKGTFSIYSDSGDNNWYLKFTKKSETPTRLVEEDSAISVFADNGTIYTNGRDLRIYTLTGIEVTAQNGTLNGIYVVKTNGKIVKVSVR